MSGHSHWAGIKRRKGAADQKRGQIFSKLLSAVAIAARTESNPEFNPRLRAAILKAKESKVPQENILRAIERASEDKNLEELTMEAYGPEGAAILIEAITDSKNRTIAEIKKFLSEAGAKWAEAGSVRWAFHKGEEGWQAKFQQEVSPDAKEKIQALVSELKNHDDVQGVYTNS